MAIQFVTQEPTKDTVDAPDGPYLYDDARFIYDEPCLFYDGGFSLQCLVNLAEAIRIPKKIVGRSGWWARRQEQLRKERPKRETLDIEVKTALCRVNDKRFDEECEDEIIKRYKLDFEPIKVEVDRIKHEQSELYVYSQAVTSSARIPEIKTHKIKLLPVKTIVSSSAARRHKPKLIVKSEVIRKKKK